MKAYLQNLDDMMPKHAGWTYRSLYGAVLALGKAYPSVELDRAQRETLLKIVKADHPHPKECFFNAQKLALFAPTEFRYVEGYACGHVGIPVLHGWCVHAQTGAVVDPTFRLDFSKPVGPSNTVVGRIFDGWGYFGVELPTEAVRLRWLATGLASSFFDDPPEWPIVRDGWAGVMR